MKAAAVRLSAYRKVFFWHEERYYGSTKNYLSYADIH